MSSPTPLRRELLVSLGILFGGVTLLLGIAISLVLPFLRSTGEATAFILIIVAVDLVIVLTFGGWALKKNLLEPVDELVRGVKQIADGDYRHRLELPGGLELRSITESVNAMADRLIAGQEVLAENVRSLDETNVKLIEARNEVIQAARLASVGTLAAGIAHEVGNPLTAIIGYADVALRRAEAGQEDPELLESIRSEAQRIDGIVRGLLDFARPQADEIAPVRVDEVVQGVRELLQNQGRLGQIEHSWTLDDTCPPVLMAPRHLEQVLVNLLLNASDAVKDLDAPKIEVALWSEAGPAANPLLRRGDDPPGVNYLHRRRVACHIAIIMDGNGRWARQRNQPRIVGHRAGAKAVRDIVVECHRLGVGYLTLFSFSMENWKRPADEVRGLMGLYLQYLGKERQELVENNIRFLQLGRREGLPESVLREVDQTIAVTSQCTGLTLCLALNYGARTEITDAVQAIAREVQAGRLQIADIDEDTISHHLYTAGLPDPDLLIRTAGELRVSNYLLWQISYCEIQITDVYWPDFRVQHLHDAIRDYADRDRRFGGLGHTSSPA